MNELPPSMRSFRSDLVTAIDRRAAQNQANRRRRAFAVAAAFLVVAGAVVGLAVSTRDRQGADVRMDREPLPTTTTVPVESAVPVPLEPSAMPVWREVPSPEPGFLPSVAATSEGFTMMAGYPDLIRAWLLGDEDTWGEVPVDVPAEDYLDTGFTWLVGHHDGLFYVSTAPSGIAIPTLLVGPSLDALEPAGIDLTAPAPEGGHLFVGYRIDRVDLGEHGIIIRGTDVVNLDFASIVPPEIWDNLAPHQLYGVGDREVRVFGDGTMDIVWRAPLSEVLTPEEYELFDRTPFEWRNHVWVSLDGTDFTKVTPPAGNSQFPGIAVVSDGFEVYDSLSDDQAVDTPSAVWWSADGTAWERRPDLPARPALDSVLSTGSAQPDVWVGDGGGGVLLSSVDSALGLGSCSDESTRCASFARRASRGDASLVVAETHRSTIGSPLDTPEEVGARLYWSPDGKRWATTTLSEATGLPEDWHVQGLYAASDGALLIVAVKQTMHDLGPTFEVRMFLADSA